MIKTSFCSLQSYFKDAWNTFDFITVVGSIVDALMVEFAVSVYLY
jgi:voltage-dependent calcium channel N type alpha-1B